MERQQRDPGDITFWLSETRQRPWWVQVAVAVLFQDDAERSLRYVVHACDEDGYEWFRIATASEEEAHDRARSLESEFRELGTGAFLTKYSSSYRELTDRGR